MLKICVIIILKQARETMPPETEIRRSTELQKIKRKIKCGQRNSKRAKLSCKLIVRLRMDTGSHKQVRLYTPGSVRIFVYSSPDNERETDRRIRITVLMQLLLSTGTIGQISGASFPH